VDKKVTMGRRLDVRRMLLARGRQEGPTLWLLLRNGDLVWGSPTEHRDSALYATRAGYQIQFPGDMPARVIVAACEAAEHARPPRRSTASQRAGAGP
jgi:hypothetical protein